MLSHILNFDDIHMHLGRNPTVCECVCVCVRDFNITDSVLDFGTSNGAEALLRVSS